MGKTEVIKINEQPKWTQQHNIVTFSVHSSKKAKLTSLSDTKERSSINRMNVCVLISKEKNFKYALSRLFKNPAKENENGYLETFFVRDSNKVII